MTYRQRQEQAADVSMEAKNPNMRLSCEKVDSKLQNLEGLVEQLFRDLLHLPAKKKAAPVVMSLELQQEGKGTPGSHKKNRKSQLNVPAENVKISLVGPQTRSQMQPLVSKSFSTREAGGDNHHVITNRKGS